MRTDSTWSYCGSCAQARCGGRGPGHLFFVVPGKKRSDGPRLLGAQEGGSNQESVSSVGRGVVAPHHLKDFADPPGVRGVASRQLQWSARQRGAGRGAGVFPFLSRLLFHLCPHTLSP